MMCRTAAAAADDDLGLAGGRSWCVCYVLLAVFFLQALAAGYGFSMCMSACWLWL